MDEWNAHSQKYSEEQVAAVLADIGIEVISDTRTNYLCLCPFHVNDNSPALSIHKGSGLFMCFNPSCALTGDLVKLVRKRTALDYFPARRLIAKHENPAGTFVRKTAKKDKALPKVSNEAINNLYDNFWKNQDAQDYMHGRGFDKKTLENFKVGFSVKKKLIAVPMHDKKGNPVGVIGRSIESKRFENSANLPTSRTLFNLHRAKKAGDKVIVVEASFDAMKIHQAGFPCVVALCMGTLSSYHIEYLDMYFNTIVIATDFDDSEKHKKENCIKCSGNCLGHNPGRMLGEKIAKELKHKVIRWAAYSDGIIYPNGAKDPGDLTIEQIQQTMNNSVSDFYYRQWKKRFPNLAIV